MIYFYAPMGFVSVVAFGLWMRVLIEFRRNKAFGSLYVKKLLRHVIMAVVIFTLFLAMFAHRLYNALSDSDSFALMELHTVALCGIGFWLFLVFGASAHHLQACRDWVQRRNRYETLN
jgi:hypothetical protein